tara:strand:+ start:2591 stop:2803 length:213 start_codon:yes stop_codon:yes gene_type:complete
MDNKKVQRESGFWKQGKVIIPLWITKYGNERMCRKDMALLGAPIPDDLDEQIYKKWSEINGDKYLPPNIN